MICDFGIAAGAQAIADSNMRGVLFGSPAFMAPEQAFTPDKVDFRADIYALATTACFLLTGKTPFDGHSRDERLLLKAENNIPDPILANGKKPCREFLNVLRKMGAADPEERYQDYRTLIADLEYLSLFYADRAKKLPQTLMKRKRSFFLGLGFGVVGICVAIGIFYFQRYLNLLEENNYVSKTISMIFWEGEQDGWRIFQRDFGTDQPSLIGTAGAASLMLREPLQPGQSVKFSIRLQGSQSTTISLLDEQHERRASFAFYGFRDSQQLLIRMNIEQDNMPMGVASLATELDWTNIKISVTARQIWFYVNGELRGFRHLDKEVEGWHLQIDEVRSNYLQIKDFFVTKMDSGNGA
jgi:serine/threonine protein kinase